MNDKVLEKIRGFDEVRCVEKYGEYVQWKEILNYDIYFNAGIPVKYIIYARDSENNLVDPDFNDFVISLSEYLDVVGIKYFERSVPPEQDLKLFLLKLNEIVNIHPDIKDLFNISLNKGEVYI